MYLYVSVCIEHIVCIVSMLYVSYVLAQAGTDAVTTSLQDPPLGQHHAAPTQVTPGQQPDHFFQPSVTHSRTRFGAPARAARVGGGAKRVPGATNGPHLRCLHTAISRQAPSELI